MANRERSVELADALRLLGDEAEVHRTGSAPEHGVEHAVVARRVGTVDALAVLLACVEREDALADSVIKPDAAAIKHRRLAVLVSQGSRTARHQAGNGRNRSSASSGAGMAVASESGRRAEYHGWHVGGREPNAGGEDRPHPAFQPSSGGVAHSCDPSAKNPRRFRRGPCWRRTVTPSPTSNVHEHNSSALAPRGGSNG